MPPQNKPQPKRTTPKPLQTSSSLPNETPSALPEDIRERARNEKLLANKNYFFYLSSLLQKTQLYHLWNRYLGFFRKIRFISFLLRIYSYLLVLLQLGTAFFVIIVGLCILIPIFALGAVFVIFSALLLYHRENKNMISALSDKKITVFFPTRGGEFGTGDFWKDNIQEIARQKNTTVLIVSPFFWSGRGMIGNRFYLLLRKEKENIYLLRKHYYFSLKRAILEKKRDSLSLIY